MGKPELEFTVPNKEVLLEQWFNTKHELKYIVTAKTFKDPTEFFLYEFAKGKFKRLHKARTPASFRDKVDLTK